MAKTNGGTVKDESVDPTTKLVPDPEKTPAQKVAEAQAMLDEAQAELKVAQDEEVAAKLRSIPRFDPDSPTVVLEDGGSIVGGVDDPEYVMSGGRTRQVRVGGRVYDHVRDFDGLDDTGAFTRWAYRHHP